MGNRIQNLSISRKTIILLFLFVLLPSITVGSFVICGVYVRNEETERKLTLQKLENRGQSIVDFMGSIETMGNDLAIAPSVVDIVKNGKESTRFYECTSLIKDTLRYNDHIIKVQIIKNGKVIWNVGTGGKYVFDDSGNEEFASRIEEKGEFAFWSPAHALYSLENGTFSEEFWMTTYYQGIVDMNRMSVIGVLAIQILEEDFCSVYQDILESTSVAAWIENKDGEVISATEKAFLDGRLPEEFITPADYRSDGYRNGFRYQGRPVTAYRERCGNTDYYCVQVNWRESMQHRIFLFVVCIGILFLLFCLVFLLIYRKLVIQPLEDLSGRMERTRRMADNKQQQEYSSLQNVASYDEQGSEQGKKMLQGTRYLHKKGDEIQSLTSHFQEMLGEIDDLINKVYVEKIKSQQAEQQVLLEQINPHFLYNTLDSIHWNALRNGDRETGEQLEALSAMLRETLNLGHKHTTVERELSVVHNYCYLLETRFRKDIQVTIEKDNTVLQESIPKLILQPLIENAYRHGLENIIGHKQITVKVKRAGDALAFYVADNGKGCNRAEILSKMEQDTGECFALRNIRDRLQLEYDGKAVFHFWSREGVGTIVKLLLPMKEEDI